MTSRLILSLSCLLVIALGAAARAQTPDQGVEHELAGIHRSLREIAGLLRAQNANERLGLVLRRVELKAARLLPLEQELRRAEQEKADTEQELKRLDAFLKSLDDEIFEAGVVGADAVREQNRAPRLEVTTGIELTRERLWHTEQRILDLAGEIADGRRQVASWERYVDEQLGME